MHYDVDWYEVIVSDGYNINKQSYDKDKPTYHVNGRIVILSGLSITKTVDVNSASVGDTLHYTITVIVNVINIFSLQAH